MKNLKDLTILIVDDSSCIKSILIDILRDIEIQNIEEATSMSSAWHLLLKLYEEKKCIVDLIISDWCMPGGSGLELLKKVRDHNNFNSIPFFMLTAEVIEESQLAAEQAGVTCYITKPFTSQVIIDKINYFVVNK